MKKSSEEFNIDTYTKPGFNLVVELDDDVEYLVNAQAVVSIKNNEPAIFLKRLFDMEMKAVALESVIESLESKGANDYLKARKIESRNSQERRL